MARGKELIELKRDWKIGRQIGKRKE